MATAASSRRRSESATCSRPLPALLLHGTAYIPAERHPRALPRHRVPHPAPQPLLPARPLLPGVAQPSHVLGQPRRASHVRLGAVLQPRPVDAIPLHRHPQKAAGRSPLPVHPPAPLGPTAGYGVPDASELGESFVGSVRPVSPSLHLPDVERTEKAGVLPVSPTLGARRPCESRPRCRAPVPTHRAPDGAPTARRSAPPPRPAGGRNGCERRYRASR